MSSRKAKSIPTPPTTKREQNVAVLELPPKVRELFRDAQKLFDEKKFKRAQKEVESILKKEPNCAEALSLKALILLNTNGDREEMLKSVRQCLKLDPTSFASWHILGMVHKTCENFAEAEQSFLTSKRLTKSPHITVLRDLAWVQLGRHEYDKYLTNMFSVWMLRGDVKIYWLAFAVGMHLNGNIRQAAHFMEAVTSASDFYDYETPHESSELELYRIRLLAESGDIEKAQIAGVELMKRGKCVDHISLYELLSRIESNPTTSIRGLLELLPRNNDYLIAYFSSLKSFQHIFPPLSPLRTSETRSFKTSRVILPTAPPEPLRDGEPFPQVVYPDFMTRAGIRLASWIGCPNTLLPVPKSAESFSGSDFQRISQREWRVGRLSSPWGSKFGYYSGCSWSFLYSYYSAGTSDDDANAIMAEIQELYQDGIKRSDVTELFVAPFFPPGASFVSFITKFIRKHVLAVSPSVIDMIKTLLLLNPVKRLCILTAVENVHSEILQLSKEGNLKLRASLPLAVALRSLCSFIISPGSDSSLLILESGIEHTPTFVELLTLKADMLSSLGAHKERSDLIMGAALLDQNDRFLNTLATEAAIKLGHIEKGLKFARQFTAQSEAQGGGQNFPEKFSDIQLNQLELCLGNAHAAMGQYNAAANRFQRIYRRADSTCYDSQEMNQYALRKQNLNSFTTFLEFLQKTPSHILYRKSAFGLLKIAIAKLDGYLKVHDSLPDTQTRQATKKKDDTKIFEPRIDVNFNLATDPDLVTRCSNLLTVMNASCEGDIKYLSYRCRFYMRQYALKPLAVIQSLNQLYTILGSNVFHYKFIPLFTQFVLFKDEILAALQSTPVLHTANLSAETILFDFLNRILPDECKMKTVDNLRDDPQSILGPLFKLGESSTDAIFTSASCLDLHSHVKVYFSVASLSCASQIRKFIDESIARISSTRFVPTVDVEKFIKRFIWSIHELRCSKVKFDFESDPVVKSAGSLIDSIIIKHPRSDFCRLVKEVAQSKGSVCACLCDLTDALHYKNK